MKFSQTAPAMDKRLNIAFILPENVSRNAIGLSDQIKSSAPVNFRLNKTGSIPHITVYQLIIPDRNLNRLIKTLEGLVLNLPPQKFKFAGFENHSGYISALLAASKRVKQFQEEVIQGLNSLREGRNLIGKDDSFFNIYPEKQRKNIIRYGFDNLLDFYNPHITVTCMINPEKAEQLANELSWSEKEFYCLSIGLYTLGKFGTCKRLIREFKLKGGD